MSAVLDLSQHSLNPSQYGIGLSLEHALTPPPVDFVFTGIVQHEPQRQSPSPSFGVDDHGSASDSHGGVNACDSSAKVSDTSVSPSLTPSASASASNAFVDEHSSKSKPHRISALQIMRRDSFVSTSRQDRDGYQSGSGSRSASTSNSADGNASSKSKRSQRNVDRRNLDASSRSSGGSRSRSKSDRSLNSNGNVMERRERRPSFHLKGQKCDRDAFLQKTKCRSWANMEGYSSLDRLNRNNLNKPWVKGRGTSPAKKEEFSPSSLSPPRYYQPRTSASAMRQSHANGIKAHSSHCHHHPYLSQSHSYGSDPYSQHAQYAERLKRKSTEHSPHPHPHDSPDMRMMSKKVSHLMRERQALKRSNFISQQEQVVEPATIPADIVNNSAATHTHTNFHKHAHADGHLSNPNSCNSSSSDRDCEPRHTSSIDVDIEAEAKSVSPPKSMLIQQSHRKSKVAFSTVEVRHYNRIMGDNPACSSGPPISIGWDVVEEKTLLMSVDDFDYYHGMNRDEINMVLTRQEREELLLDLGYSSREMAEAVRKNIKWKNRRRQTVNNLSVMKMEELVESTIKHFGRIRLKSRRSSGSQLYIQWKDHSYLGSEVTSTNDDFSSASTLKSCLKLGNSEKTSTSSTYSHALSHSSRHQSAENYDDINHHNHKDDSKNEEQ